MAAEGQILIAQPPTYRCPTPQHQDLLSMKTFQLGQRRKSGLAPQNDQKVPSVPHLRKQQMSVTGLTTIKRARSSISRPRAQRDIALVERASALIGHTHTQLNGTTWKHQGSSMVYPKWRKRRRTSLMTLGWGSMRARMCSIDYWDFI